MDTGLDALAVALYVTIDDLLSRHPEQVPRRPSGGFTWQISDAELVTLAMMGSMLQFTSERRWLRHANTRLRHLFPYLPQQPGYNKTATPAGRDDVLADRAAGRAGQRRRR